MSSIDEDVSSPVLGASSSKDLAPVTQLGSKSVFDDGVKKRVSKYKRPRAKRNRNLLITKGADTDPEVDDGERKLQIAQGACEAPCAI
jgi:hypothetical protein